MRDFPWIMRFSRSPPSGSARPGMRPSMFATTDYRRGQRTDFRACREGGPYSSLRGYRFRRVARAARQKSPFSDPLQASPLPQARPQAALLLVNLPGIKAPLQSGCVVVFDDARLRIRRLPVGGEEPADHPKADDDGSLDSVPRPTNPANGLISLEELDPDASRQTSVRRTPICK
jgi:hypothetical protein